MAPPAPPPASNQVALTASNYQNAAKLSMGIATMAFTYAKLGVTITDAMINVPVLLTIPVPCPEGGTTAYELTDQNRDMTLDPGDRLDLRWDACRTQGTTLSGLMRVEVNTATDTPAAREYLLAVSIVDLRITPAAGNVPPGLQPAAINFFSQVRYTRTATSDHTVLIGASFSTSPVIGDAGLSVLGVDYYQDYATQTYEWSAQGTIDSQVIGGEFDFRQTSDFTGVLGEYPSAGRLTLTGLAGSTARLSEEGAAANDVNLVYVGVDSNGDGTADAADGALAWSAVVPVQIFAAFPDTTTVALP